MNTHHPYQPSEDESARAIKMLDRIPPQQYCSYLQWLKVGMALHSVNSGLLAEWVDWSRSMPTFNEQECIAKWSSFNNHRSMLTIRSLCYWANQYGYQEHGTDHSGALIVPRGSTGGDVGKVSWIIEGFLAKGATALLASEAGAGKTSLLMRAAASVEHGTPFLDQIDTKQGRVLFIQGDEPEVDSRFKQRLMDLEGVCDFAYPTSTLDLDWYEKIAQDYDFTIIDSSTSMLTHEGSYHEDPAFTSKLYKLGAINSKAGIGCIISTHLRKSADGVPRKDLTVEDIAGRSTIRNALQDYWGLMRNPSPRWDEHYTLKCFGKRYCKLGEQWELQGDPESFWWGIQDVHNGLPPRERRILEQNLIQWFRSHPEPMSAKSLATELVMNYEHVRRSCMGLFTQDKLKREPDRQGQMGRPMYKYYSQ